MRIPSPGVVALIADFEKFRSTAYQDEGGVWTLGHGFTRISGRPVQQGDAITYTDSLAELRRLVTQFGIEVADLVTVRTIPQMSFDALVSFTYNVGRAAFAESTLLKHVNVGAYALAADEFPRWNLVKGKVSNGLIKRRAVERALFLYGVAL